MAYLNDLSSAEYDKLAERVAREMAMADGKNPDDFVNNLFGEPTLHWRGYLREAKLHLAARRALAQFEQR